MEKLFLLDAYALIYRAYYAFIKNPRINSKGFNTSAILGFVNTLEEVLRKENPTHIGIAFDPSGPTFRHEAAVGSWHKGYHTCLSYSYSGDCRIRSRRRNRYTGYGSR